MPRIIAPLKAELEGESHVVRFHHPLMKRVLRLNLDKEGEWRKNLDALNAIRLNKAYWHELPATTPPLIRRIWQPTTTTLKGNTVSHKGRVIDSTESALIVAENEALRHANAGLLAENIRLKKQIESLLGRRIRSGPAPTLAVARDEWLKQFENIGDKKDPGHLATVKSDIKRFVIHFGENTSIDALEGNEEKIDLYISGLRNRDDNQLSPNRRRTMRTYILKFLREKGASLSQEKITTPKQVRRDIVWLERNEAKKLASKLSDYWRDVFLFQLATGMRPDELPTIRRDNVPSDRARVSLAAFENLTLKLGIRVVPIPQTTREILKRRLEASEFAFANPSDNQRWGTAEYFDKCYRKELKAAATAAGITKPVDCRTGRRTCASLLLRAGQTIEQVAALLGDDPKTVRAHYGRLLPSDTDNSAAALKPKSVKTQP